MPPVGTGQRLPDPQARRSLLLEARRRYDAAQRAGEWARYGEEIRRLGELLAGSGAVRR